MLNNNVVSMSEVSQQYDFNLPVFRTVCLPKRVFIAYYTYAPLVAFILNTVLMAGHVILFPYYLLAILSRGRPPRFLYGWVYFNSAYLYGAIHEKKEVWFDFWALYYIYFGYIVAFVLWILNIVSIALIFPIFFYIEEWSLVTKAYYRITFGNWKRIVHDCPEMRYKRGMREREEKEYKEKMSKAKATGKYHNVDVVEVVEVEDEKGEKTMSICPTCGEKIDKSTVYCSKCGSYVKH